MREDLSRAVFEAFEQREIEPGRQEEDDWSKEIAARLQARRPGSVVAVNKKYPGRSERYDICCTPIYSPGTLYVETKGAWLSYWLDNNNLSKFRSYLLSPLDGRPRPTKSAALDLEKLLTCSPQNTDWVALVLFGSSRPMHDVAAELERFAEATELRSSPWHSERRVIPNRWYPGYSYDVRVWTAEYGELGGWLERMRPRLA